MSDRIKELCDRAVARFEANPPPPWWLREPFGQWMQTNGHPELKADPQAIRQALKENLRRKTRRVSAKFP